MSQTSLEIASCPKVFVRDLADGQLVESPFVVRDRTLRQKRNGESFLKLKLADCTGMIEGVVWDEVDSIAPVATPGNVVVVSGRYSVDQRYGSCITVRAVREAAAGTFDPADLMDAPPASLDTMLEDLRQLSATVRDPDLCRLLEYFFAEGSPVFSRWIEAPAAKHYHQAYRHGLLEHCLSVAQGVHALSATFPGVDHDVAVTGALLHDIGKVEAYAMSGGAIDLSDAGKLEGEIPLGYYMVRRAIEDLPGFAADTAQAVLHIILSHHGQLEHGSPVVPCTREATLVHMIDNLGGRLGSFDRIEKALGDGERWSGFDRALSGSAYFGARAAAHTPGETDAQAA
ncbi:MAG: 3-5 exoribonuclease [Thermoleophilaceae bacterium]|jgi:3'-5' exoribonuclease|nr:3-5 exoribonuclease [Thermoleophilaceae bacterium]